MLTGDGNCFRCGQPGHWAQHCPLGLPAASKAEHERRIRLFVDRWIDGEIAAYEKQNLIRQENELWNKREKTGARK